jgi:probable poly-beta-1,6-N-acetyl-D-glucosamine export protein
MENINLVIMSSLVLAFPAFRKVFFFQNEFSLMNTPADSHSLDNNEKRFEIFDLLRGISILAVFFIHVSWFFYLNSRFTVQEESFLLIMNNLSRFAIAIFFVTSGILLKPVKISKNYLNFLKHKFFNIFLPYLLVAISLEILQRSSFSKIMIDVVSGKSSVPFYFVIILFQFYLVYPLILKFISGKLLVVSFFVSLISQFFPLTWNFFGLPIFLKYLFFFVYGVYGKEKFLSQKINPQEKGIWIFLASAYVFLSICFVDYYYNIRLVYGVAALNIFMIYKDKMISLGKIVKPIISAGRLSLWLFLLHYPIMEFCFKIIATVNLNFIFKYFLVFLLTLSICAPLAFFLDRIFSLINKSFLKTY